MSGISYVGSSDYVLPRLTPSTANRRLVTQDFELLVSLILNTCYGDGLPSR